MKTFIQFVLGCVILIFSSCGKEDRATVLNYQIGVTEQCVVNGMPAEWEQGDVIRVEVFFFMPMYQRCLYDGQDKELSLWAGYSDQHILDRYGEAQMSYDGGQWTLTQDGKVVRALRVVVPPDGKFIYHKIQIRWECPGKLKGAAMFCKEDGDRSFILCNES